MAQTGCDTPTSITGKTKSRACPISSHSATNMQSSAIVFGFVLFVVCACATSPPGEKPGECPSTEGQGGACVQGCKSDRYCPGREKCCSNGCGTGCENPKGSKSCPMYKCLGGCAMKKLPDEECPGCYCGEEPMGASLQNACKQAGGKCQPNDFSPQPEDRYLCKAAETCVFQE